MNNEIKKEKKSVLNIVLNSILTFVAILSIVFINMMSYAKGIILGAQNSEVINQIIEDELGSRKESVKRQADSSVVEPISYVVPNEGYLDNIYFNTSLTSEEVVSIIENANINFITVNPAVDSTSYLLLANSDFSYGVVIEKQSLGGIIFYTIVVGNFTDNTVIFDSNPYQDDGTVGWQFLQSSYLVDSELVDTFQGLSVGAQNDSLVDLVSTQPFEQPSVFEKFLLDASDIVLGFVTILSTAAISLSDVFIDSSNKLTIVGSAMVLALAVGVIYLLFRMVRGLIKSNIRG